MRLTWTIGLCVLAMGCNGAAETDAGPRADSGMRRDSGMLRTDSGTVPRDSGTGTDSGGPTDSGPPTDSGNMFTLTFTDEFNWCAITVDGDPVPSDGAAHTYMFPAGTVVPLVGDDDGSGSFKWGFWLGTDGHTGTDRDPDMNTMVTMDSNRTVKSCCPFDSDGGATDGCNGVTL